MKLSPANKPEDAGPRRAFSLVELLVSVGIVTILAMFAIPSAGRILENSRSAKCQSNLRQLGVAMVGYRADNGDSLPKAYDSSTAAFWFDVLMGAASNAKTPYINSPKVLACPSKTQGALRFSPPTVVGFGMMDAYLWYPTPHRSQEESRLALKVIKQSEWPLLMDADYPVVYGLDNPTADAARDSRFAARHNDRANVFMLDGHIERVAYGDKRWQQKNLNDNIR